MKQGLIVSWPPHADPVELIGTGSGSISMDTRISTIGRALSNTTSSDLYAPTAKSTGWTEIFHMYKTFDKAADIVFFECCCFLLFALTDYEIDDEFEEEAEYEIEKKEEEEEEKEEEEEP